MTDCPCGSKKNYEECCQPFIDGKAIPKTPEALMRSRYTAFTQANIDYVEKTMKGAALKDFDRPETKRWAEQSNWLKLTILKSHIDKKDPTRGGVEFIAEYKTGKQLCQMHEVSEFRLENGRWYYYDGEFVADPVKTHQSNKVSRNDPCPCGSNKKYKKCCGKHN